MEALSVENQFIKGEIEGGKMTVGQKLNIEGRYWNTNGVGICIVAVITEDIDWAAYIGADAGWEEEACIKWASAYGAKLSAQDGKHFFPDIKLPYRG